MTLRKTAIALGAAAILVSSACGGSDSAGIDSVPADETEAAPVESAESGGTNEDGPLIFAIYKLGTQQYFIDQANGAQATVDSAGGEIRVINVEEDANAAITAVNDAIAAGADGIAITVPDQSIGPSIAQAAQDAGIPLIATDDAIEDAEGNSVPFVGFSGTAMGESVGETACSLVAEAGWGGDAATGALIVTKDDLTVIRQRTDAEKSMLTGCGFSDSQLLDVPSDSTIEGALADAGPVITANQDVTNWIVVGGNDESVKGAIQALEVAGVSTDQIIGVGLGAYEACKEWQAGQDSGFKAALFLSGQDVGATAMTALIQSAQDGSDHPAESIAPTSIVDPTSWQEAPGLCA